VVICQRRTSRCSWQFCPSKLASIRFNQPWINREIKQLARQKKRPTIKPEGPSRLPIGQSSVCFVQTKCRAAYGAYINKIISDPDDSANNITGCNNKKFFGYIKSLRNDHCGISCLKQNGVAYSDSQSKAEVFNDHFSSVFTTEDTLSDDICLDSNQFPDISDIIVHTGGVVKILRELNEHKASGPDQLTARLLKEVANEIVPALALLFQATSGQASSWLESCICHRTV